MKDPNELEEKIGDIIEDIQECVINAGGKFFRRKELKGMTLENLLRQFLPNQISFKISNLKGVNKP